MKIRFVGYQASRSIAWPACCSVRSCTSVTEILENHLICFQVGIFFAIGNAFEDSELKCRIHYLTTWFAAHWHHWQCWDVVRLR